MNYKEYRALKDELWQRDNKEYTGYVVDPVYAVPGIDRTTYERFKGLNFFNIKVGCQIHSRSWLVRIDHQTGEVDSRSLICALCATEKNLGEFGG